MVVPHLASPRSDGPASAAHATKAPLQVVDHDISATIRPENLARLSAPLTRMLTLELDGAQQSLGLDIDEILLAALGRTIARVIGDGIVTVDVAADGRSVALACTTVQQASATETLSDVHRTVTATRRHQLGTGLLQYLHAPSEVCFNYVAAVPQSPPGETPPGPAHALELRVYRTAGVLYLDWWYDIRRFHRSTVDELAEQFPLALIELTSEAVAPI
jgi:hypothetical protein